MKKTLFALTAIILLLLGTKQQQKKKQTKLLDVEKLRNIGLL